MNILNPFKTQCYKKVFDVCEFWNRCNTIDGEREKELEGRAMKGLKKFVQQMKYVASGENGYF